MTATTLPSPAAELVQRLLSTEDASARKSLLARQLLTDPELRDAVDSLLAAARPLYGANPLRMEATALDALSLAQIANDRYLIAMSTMVLGDALRAQGRNAESCARADEAQATFDSLDCTVESARTRIGWVEAMARRGHIPDALRQAARTRRTLAAHNMLLQVATLDLTVGNINAEHGRYRRALQFFTAAKQGFERLSNRLLVARCDQNRGFVLARLGRDREALESLEVARGAFEAMNERGGAARASHNIGLVLMNRGQINAALKEFESAKGIAVEIGLGSWTNRVNYDLADCYLLLNRPADALTALAESPSDVGAIENVQDALGVATRRIAAYYALGDSDRALETTIAVQARLGKESTHHLAALEAKRALVLCRSGRLDEAIEAATRAQQLARASAMRGVLADASLAEAEARLALDQSRAARRAADRALRLARAEGSAPLLHRANEILGTVAWQEGRGTEAERRFRAAITYLERVQQSLIFEFRDSFADNRTRAYEYLAVIEAVNGDARAALLTAERAKSRALADTLAGTIAPNPRRTVVARRLSRELASVRRQYAAILGTGETPSGSGDRNGANASELEARIARLIQRVQLEGTAESEAKIGELNDTVALPHIPGGTLLIEFFFSGDDILRFQLDRAGVRCDVLKGAVSEVERSLRLFRLNLDATQHAGPGRVSSLSAQAKALLGRLYDRLVADVPLEDNSTLVVIPHGILHYLPFHALYDGERYLVERVSLTVAPSATVYGACTLRRRYVSRALVLGHSAGGALSSAIDEAREIASVLDGTLLLEDEATRAAIEAAGSRAQLLHIAAHGRFRADAPLFSAVELADGPLTTADVYSLRLNAALVSLSACETGRGVLGGGDELAGLARAFLCAGTSTLLVSQWRVDDASTSELMRRFYLVLSQGAGTAAALQAAQVELLNRHDDQHSHPFFWAGFQVVGSDQPVFRKRTPEKESHKR